MNSTETLSRYLSKDLLRKTDVQSMTMSYSYLIHIKIK